MHDAGVDAALLISLLALAVSSWAAYNSHTTRQAADRAADAAEVSADTATEALELGHATEQREKERAYLEQTPVLVADVPGKGATHQTVRLRNDTRFTYDTLNLTIKATSEDPVEGFAWGVDPVEVVDEIGPVGGLPPQGVYELVVMRRDMYPASTLYLIATATRGAAKWTVEVTVDLPRGPGRVYAF